jgi:hypothetical protein
MRSTLIDPEFSFLPVCRPSRTLEQSRLSIFSAPFAVVVSNPASVRGWIAPLTGIRIQMFFRKNR